MIAAVIRWSARNVFLVGLATIFVALAGIYAVSRVPLDAIPDLSDVQVIVYTEYAGQAPQVVEDQVTYPLTTAMLSVPKSRPLRRSVNSKNAREQRIGVELTTSVVCTENLRAAWKASRRSHSGAAMPSPRAALPS
jgi:Cu/Ag efflux pump CusA